MRKAPILAMTLVALTALLLPGCKTQRTATASAKEKTEVSATPVSAMSVAPRTLEEAVEITGTLQPANEVTVGPRFAGKIVWIIGKAGTPVKAGQLVARTDEADALIQLRSARAAENAAAARLEQAKAAVTQQKTSTDSGILTAEAALEAAKARLQQAKTSRNALASTTNAQIKQAEQGLNAANSRLQLLKNGSRSQERQIAENNKQLAEATLNNDKRNYERLKMLNEQGAVAKSSLDAAETKLQISQAQYDSAAQQLSLVSEGPRREDIDGAEAAVGQAKAMLESAKAGLDQIKVADDNVAIAQTGVAQAEAGLQTAKSAVNVDTMRDKDVLAAQAGLQQAKEAVASAQQMIQHTKVYSPVNGVVAAKLAEEGQSVGASAEVLRITTNNVLSFEAQVSELEATRLRAGQPVLLEIDAMQGNRTNMYGKPLANAIAATVERVVPVVDARTRNFTVRVVVNNTKDLYPGMFARGQVLVNTHTNIIAVPKDVIVDKQGKKQVFVVDGDVAHARTVVLGASDGQYVQILAGLSVGDQVITVGQQTLLDGDKIKLSAQSAN